MALGRLGAGFTSTIVAGGGVTLPDDTDNTFGDDADFVWRWDETLQHFEGVTPGGAEYWLHDDEVRASSANDFYTGFRQQPGQLTFTGGATVTSVRMADFGDNQVQNPTNNITTLYNGFFAAPTASGVVTNTFALGLGGNLGLPDGSFGAPSGTFTSETTTGVYRPGAGVLGLAGIAELQATRTRTRGLASAASDLADLTHTPGTVTLTGATPTNSLSHVTFADTQITNATADIDGLFNIDVVAPTASGTKNGTAAIRAHVANDAIDQLGVYIQFDAAVSNNWEYSIGIGEADSPTDPNFGVFASLESGGNHLTAWMPPSTATDGTSGSGGIVMPPSGKAQFPQGLIVARERRLGFSADQPTSAGTTGVDNAEIAAFTFDRTSATADVLKLGVPDDSATISSELAIVPYAAIDSDYNLAIETDPTLRIFSDGGAAAPTEWIKFQHDGGSAIVESGSGGIMLKEGSTTYTFNTTQFATPKPIRGGAGLVGTPTYSFTGVTNTGMYLDGTSLAFTVAGTKQLDITTAGVVSGPATVTKTFLIPAASFVPATTSGATGPVQKEYATNDVDLVVMTFPDGSTTYAIAHVPLPDGYDGGTLTARVLWTDTPGGGASAAETVQFLVDLKSLTDDDAIDSAWGSAGVINDTVIASGDMHRTPFSSAITPSGSPSGGDFLIISVARNEAASSITGGIDMIGLQLEYKAKLTDA